MKHSLLLLLLAVVSSSPPPDHIVPIVLKDSDIIKVYCFSTDPYHVSFHPDTESKCKSNCPSFPGCCQIFTITEDTVVRCDQYKDSLATGKSLQFTAPLMHPLEKVQVISGRHQSITCIDNSITTTQIIHPTDPNFKMMYVYLSDGAVKRGYGEFHTLTTVSLPASGATVECNKTLYAAQVDDLAEMPPMLYAYQSLALDHHHVWLTVFCAGILAVQACAVKYKSHNKPVRDPKWIYFLKLVFLLCAYFLTWWLGLLASYPLFVGYYYLVTLATREVEHHVKLKDGFNLGFISVTVPLLAIGSLLLPHLIKLVYRTSIIVEEALFDQYDDDEENDEVNSAEVDSDEVDGDEVDGDEVDGDEVDGAGE